MKRRAGLATALLMLSITGTAPAESRKWTEVHIVTEGGFLPWNYTRSDGVLAGFEIDLANDLCRRMQVKCTVTGQSFNSLIPALQAGKFDAIIDDLTVTTQRGEVIAFSIPYASACYTFAALRGSDIAERFQGDRRLISLASEPAAAIALEPLRAAFKGRKIGVLTAGTSVAFVDAYFQDIALIRQYMSPEARDLDLVAGRVDVVITSKDALMAPSAGRRRDLMTVVGPCFQGGVVGAGPGVGLRKQDIELKALFDEAIAAAKKDGTIRRLSMPVFGMDVTPQ